MRVPRYTIFGRGYLNNQLSVIFFNSNTWVMGMGHAHMGDPTQFPTEVVDIIIM